MEGVALTDGKHVFKVFDYWWKSSHGATAQAYLRTLAWNNTVPGHPPALVETPPIPRSGAAKRSRNGRRPHQRSPLAGAWKDTRCLYPILAFHEWGHRAVLVYPFEPSEPYTGGHGPGMVELLAECRRHGVVCRNLHPDNLRVVAGRVRLIDYGSDIRPLEDEQEFVTMCRRGWLSYRWAKRPDLTGIMRRALDDTAIPELDGFERFHEAVRRVTGQDETSGDLVPGLVGRAERVLDYGCGDGKLARAARGPGHRSPGLRPRPHPSAALGIALRGATGDRWAVAWRFRRAESRAPKSASWTGGEQSCAIRGATGDHYAVVWRFRRAESRALRPALRANGEQIRAIRRESAICGSRMNEARCWRRDASIS